MTLRAVGCWLAGVGALAALSGCSTLVAVPAHDTPSGPQVYPPPAPMDVPATLSKSPPKKQSDLVYRVKDEPDPFTEAAKGVRSAFGYGPNEQVARKAFDEGEALFKEKKYDEAAKKFKSAADRWPDSLLEEDARFMLGESYFFADRYASAHDTYGELMKKFENTRYLDTVVKREFAIGRYWEQMYTKRPHWPVTPNLTDKTMPWFDSFGHALDAYERVRLQDPTGPLADSSVMATASAHFAREQWEDAEHYYEMLRKEYPNSQFQMQAHLLGMTAEQQIYQGKDYDGAPLKKEEEIAKQTLVQFASKLPEDERARVLETTHRITENKAQREWAMGQYYEKKRYYGAARYYYQNVLKDYPLTQTAQVARKRLEEIKDYPDAPTNHLRWLTNALGDDD